ncbi:MAG TPA: hypothetical protein VGW10_09630 [Solirubrobacteraceae bacterium]|nr:hypothetical protein [Solirubrobacteraceae bacterium]
MYSQSPQSIPSAYDAVQEAEEILRQNQRTLPPSSPKAPSLWRQIRNVGVKTALTAAPRVLGAVTLAPAAFELGWKIGNGLNAKFLRLGVPEEPSLDNYFSDPTMEWVPQGARISHGGTAPAGAFYFHTVTSGGPLNGFLRANPAFGGACSTSYDPAPAGGWTDAVVGTADCFQTYFKPFGYRDIHAYYMTEEELGAPGPIEPYVDQPYDRVTQAPPSPTQSSVEQSIERELGQPRNADLRRWINHQLGSPSEEDPTGQRPDNPDIEFPGFVEKWEVHGDEFPEYADPWEYWHGAADVIRRWEAGDLETEHCVRDGDGADIYWDNSTGAIVVVKDGKIVTFFKPGTGRSYYLAQCAG